VDFQKCKFCREPFFSHGNRLCQQCQEQIDKDFVTVRDYIYDHPHNAGVDQISSATGVGEKTIIYLLEEDRLTSTAALAISAGLRCKICGRNINTGAICDSCKATITKDLDAAASALNEKGVSKTASAIIRGAERDSQLISEYGKKSKN
jgi:predicted amidophosphoribosyltransferase